MNEEEISEVFARVPNSATRILSMLPKVLRTSYATTENLLEIHAIFTAESPGKSDENIDQSLLETEQAKNSGSLVYAGPF